MNDKFFLDTNIFIYDIHEAEKEKKNKSRALIIQALDTQLGIISHQVIQEFINVATRKIEVTMTPEDCRLYVHRHLFPLWKINSTEQLIFKSLDIFQKYKYSFYDSLIIASALEASCKILYSEDLQSKQMIEGLTIINPFV